MYDLLEKRTVIISSPGSASSHFHFSIQYCFASCDAGSEKDRQLKIIHRVSDLEMPLPNYQRTIGHIVCMLSVKHSSYNGHCLNIQTSRSMGIFLCVLCLCILEAGWLFHNCESWHSIPESCNRKDCIREAASKKGATKEMLFHKANMRETLQ